MKKTYETYKDSGIEWIGKIPSHWKTIRFVHTHSGTNVGEAIDKTYWSNNIEDNIFYTAGLEPIRTNYDRFPDWKITRYNDLLMSRNGTPYVYLPYENAYYTDHVIRAQLKNGFDKRYVRFALQRSISQEIVDSVSLATWSAQIWNNQQIPYPPFVEQKAIAEFLDNKCGKIDSLVAELESQVADLEVLKKSEISRIVTKGLNPDVPLKKSGVEWVGDIPTSWQLVRLGQYTSKIGSGITPRGGSETYVENGIPLLRSQNILFDRIDVSDVAYITEEVDELMKGSRVLPGDVLLNITGASIGRCYYINEAFGPANVNQHVCIIRPKGFDTRYLYYALSSECCQTQIKVLQTGGNREGLTVEALKSFKTPMPSIYEQIKIANYLDSYRLMIDEIISLILAQISDLKLYKQSLISEAVTGKIKIID